MKRVLMLFATLLFALTGASIPIVGSADTNTPNGWTNDTARPGPNNEGLGEAAVGSSIYVLGGNNDPCRNDIYNTATDTWTSGMPPPQCIVEPGGVESDNGLVYLISGICRLQTVSPGPSACTTPAPETDTFALQIYNPTTNTWSFGATIPHPVSRAGVTVHDGKIYVIGGYNFNFGAPIGPFNFVQIYDIPTNTWSEGAPMPTAREGLLAEDVGQDIFAIGGLLQARNTFSQTSVNEKYDIDTNTWTPGYAPMPTARGIVMGDVACGTNTIFVMGGAANNMGQTANEAYFAPENEWITRAPLAPPRGEAGAETVGQEVHVIGGFTFVPENTGSDTNINQAYHCPSGVGGKVDSGSSGSPVANLTVSLLNSAGSLLSSATSATDGFFYIDAPSGGTYTLSVVNPTGSTITQTVTIPDGTIVAQDLSV